MCVNIFVRQSQCSEGLRSDQSCEHMKDLAFNSFCA